nr:myosin-2-like [Ipomoea batatas]
MGTTRTCEMRTLSSLELMLLKLQQAEEPAAAADSLPALPARPVMRARLPRARMKRSVTFLNSDLVGENEAVKGSCCCSTSTEKEAFLDSVHQQESSESDSPRDFDKAAEDEERGVLQKGVVIIQRCFRGHQACRYYHELKMGAIALQSFVRGENARNGYQCLVKRLRAIVIIQKHTREHRKRTEQLTGIICLQAGKIIDFQMWFLARITKSVYPPMFAFYRHSRLLGAKGI